MNPFRRIVDWIRPERRSKEVSWDALKYGWDTGGSSVNPRLAENLSTVVAAVNAIASAMASLPALVYRRLDRGREIDERHPVARLIANGPNSHQSWPDWLEWTMASVLLRGNALSQIIADARGAIIGLVPIPWEHVTVSLLTNGRLVYDVHPMTSINGATIRARRLLQDEVLHLRDRSDDGLIGRSRISRASSVLRGASAVQAFGTALYENFTAPSGALETDITLRPDQRDDLRDKFRSAMSGPTNAGRFLLLDSGLKWKPLTISPEDAEFLQTRRFSGEELCRLFNVPPPIVGDLTHGTFSNTETLIRLFATNTLTPWCRKLEAEFTRSIFIDPARSLELDLSGLLRGDPAQRWQAWKIARETDVLTVDEIREAEGWNPRPSASAT